MQWKNPFRKKGVQEAPALAMVGQPVEVNPAPATTRVRRQARIARLEQAFAECPTHSPKRGPIGRELKMLRLLEQAEEV